MPYIRSFLVVLILIAGLRTTAYAQTDISVELTAQPNSGLVPGQPIVFTLSVTNIGPESVPTSEYRFALFSSDIYDQFDTSFGLVDCQGYAAIVSDGKTFYFTLVWSPTFLDQGALEVGETRTCHITLALSNQAPAVWPFSFGVADFFDDLNPDNNVSTVILRRGDIAPVAVPTLSIPVFILLIVTLASMACITLAWRSSSRFS